MLSDWPAAILFDFDGVIVNSEPVHFAAFRALLADEQIFLDEREYFGELIGYDDRGALRHVLSKHRRPFDDARIESLKARKLELMKTLLASGAVPALPGAVALITALAEKYPLAICSGAVRPEIELMLDGIGLRSAFTNIVAADDVAVGKPDPEGYLLSVKLMGLHIGRTLSPADVLVIEDAPIVVDAARAAGFPVLAVTTSYPAQAVAGANWVVDNLEPASIAKKIPALKLG